MRHVHTCQLFQQVRHVLQRLATAMRRCKRGDVDEHSSLCSQGCVCPNLSFSWHVHQPCRCGSVSCNTRVAEQEAFSLHFRMPSCVSHTAVGHSGPNALLPLSGAAPQHNQNCIPVQPSLIKIHVTNCRRPSISSPHRFFSTVLYFRHVHCFTRMMCSLQMQGVSQRLLNHPNASLQSVPSCASHRLFGRARVSGSHGLSGIVFGSGFGKC